MRYMSNAPRVIGIYSPSPGSGKSTAANFLSELGYIPVSFATPLKRMVTSFLGCFGYSDLEVSGLLHHKEEIIPELGVSTRHLLQTLGTEWGRGCVHPDVWAKMWNQTVTPHLASNLHVVVDDVRFPNEAAAVLSVGGELWHITRPGRIWPDGHSSEGALKDHEYKARIVNDGSPADLRDRILQIMQVYEYPMAVGA